jgi:hypothetical protein
MLCEAMPGDPVVSSCYFTPRHYVIILEEVDQEISTLRKWWGTFVYRPLFCLLLLKKHLPALKKVCRAMPGKKKACHTPQKNASHQKRNATINP